MSASAVSSFRGDVVVGDGNAEVHFTCTVDNAPANQDNGSVTVHSNATASLRLVNWGHFPYQVFADGGTISLSGYSMQEYGHMKGTISYVDPYTTSTNDMLALLEDELLVNGYVQNGACVAVICKLKEDENAENGYYWSSPRGSSLKIHDGTWTQLTIVEESAHPIELGLPQLRELLK